MNESSMVECNEDYHISLTDDQIQVDEAIKYVTRPSNGAQSIFIGITRQTENKAPQVEAEEEEKSRNAVNGNDYRVESLFYEGYRPMALKIMREIVEEIIASNPELNGCYVCHRLGLVPLGQASILIAVGSGHRNDAHNAVMEILNKVKSRVPIWKKVNYVNDHNDKTTDDCSKLNQSGHHSCGETASSEWSTKSEAFWLK